MKEIITLSKVPDSERMAFLPAFFGKRLVMQGEAAIFGWMRRLVANYNGGFWEFFRLSNGGYLMAIIQDKPVTASSETNGYSGVMSAEAASIAANLYAFSHLSFRFQDEEVLSQRYRELYAYAVQHPEWPKIYGLID